MEAWQQECGKWVNTFKQYCTSHSFFFYTETTKTGLGHGLGQPHFFFKGFECMEGLSEFLLTSLKNFQISVSLYYNYVRFQLSDIPLIITIL